jgi:DNA-binding NarL/FixJ family response regulator
MLIVKGTLGAAPSELTADVIVWDVAEGESLPSRSTAPVLAIVAAEKEACGALSSGARGALPRSSEASRIGPAAVAVASGHVVLDPSFAQRWLAFETELAAPAGAVPSELLSPREREVLSLLSEGLSNRDIAERLGISRHTAKFHVNAILDKLGAETRTEAVVLAARSGLLTL